MTEYGFKYDKLTVADDKSVKASREKLYACPCGFGPWVSVKTGRLYTYHGGNEREQWELQKEAPWVRVSEEYRDSVVASEYYDVARSQITDLREVIDQAISVLEGAQ